MELTKAFDLLEKFGDSVPQGAKEARSAAKEAFLKSGLPTRRHELWKYTRLAGLSSCDYKWSHARGLLKGHEAREVVASNDIPIFFVDGVLDTSLTDMAGLPEGLEVSSLNKVWTDSFYSGAKSPTHPLFHLHDAFSYSGVGIHVKDGTVLKDPLHLVFINTSKPDAYCLFPRVQLTVGKRAEVSLLETHTSHGKAPKYFSSCSFEIRCEAGAYLNHYKLINDASAAHHIGFCRVAGARDSRYKTFRMLIGGQLARDEVYIDLNEEGAEARASGVYLSGKGLQTDQVIQIRHHAPRCHSHQHFRGVLREDSKGVFLGNIVVDRDAGGTVAHQLNKNLLLSESAEIDTKPQLEIDTDDVTCSHGATIGQLKEDEMFYLQSRGLDRSEAALLLSKAFAADVLVEVEDSPFKRKMTRLLESWVEA